MGAEDDLELEDASAHEDGALDGTASASGVSSVLAQLVSRVLQLKWDIWQTSANTESTSLPVHRTKKDKKKSKREALMQRALSGNRVTILTVRP